MMSAALVVVAAWKPCQRGPAANTASAVATAGGWSWVYQGASLKDVLFEPVSAPGPGLPDGTMPGPRGCAGSSAPLMCPAGGGARWAGWNACWRLVTGPAAVVLRSRQGSGPVPVA